MFIQEGHNCSTIFTHWAHSDVEVPKNDFRCRFFWIEDDAIDISEPAERIEQELIECSYIDSICLETSRHIVYNRFDTALEIIKIAREKSRFRYNSDLLGMFLRLSSLVELSPSHAARLVDLGAVINLADHSWLFDDVLSASGIKSSTTSAMALADPIPRSIERGISFQFNGTHKSVISSYVGDVFTVSYKLMLSATCWRTNAFSSAFNTIRVHNLKIENEDGIAELVLLFTPKLASSNSSLGSSEARISALAFSELGVYLFIASHAGNKESSEIGIFNMIDCTFLSTLSVSHMISQAEWSCSHTMLILWYNRGHNIRETSSNDQESMFVFVDWQKLTLKTQALDREAVLESLRLRNSSINSFQRFNMCSPKDNFERKLVEFELDLNNNDIQDIIDSSLYPNAVDFEYFTNHYLTPLDFSDDMDKRHLLIPGTRLWVFRDLSEWLHVPSGSIDIESPSAPVGKKIWLLQSPGKNPNIEIGSTLHLNR